MGVVKSLELAREFPNYVCSSLGIPLYFLLVYFPNGFLTIYKYIKLDVSTTIFILYLQFTNKTLKGFFCLLG